MGREVGAGTDCVGLGSGSGFGEVLGGYDWARVGVEVGERGRRVMQCLVYLEIVTFMLCLSFGWYPTLLLFLFFFFSSYSPLCFPLFPIIYSYCL